MKYKTASNPELHLLHLYSLISYWSRSGNGYPKIMTDFFKILLKSSIILLLSDGINKEILKKINVYWGYHFYIAFMYSARKEINDQNITAKWLDNNKKYTSKKKFLSLFNQMLEIKVQTLYPELTLPIRLIINKLNGDNKKLRIYDFGCGLNIDLQILDSDYKPVHNAFVTPHDLNKYDKPVNMLEGIGLDNNPDDLLWVKISTLSQYQDKKIMKNIEEEILTLVNLKSINKKIKTIRKTIFGFFPDRYKLADFVITKRLINQLKFKKERLSVKKKILGTLREGGYWISVGEKKNKFNFHEILVYRKNKRLLSPIMTKPIFILNNQGKIVDYNK